MKVEVVKDDLVKLVFVADRYVVKVDKVFKQATVHDRHTGLLLCNLWHGMPRHVFDSSKRRHSSLGNAWGLIEVVIQPRWD